MITTPTYRPLAHRLVPLTHPWARTAVQLVLGVAFLAALAQVRVQVGPVPITGQTLGVLLLGGAFGTRLSAATVGAYLLAGGLGLAVFTGFESGWAYFAGATGGYLVGFLLAAPLVGWLAERGWDRRPLSTAGAMVLGNLVIYAFGVGWLLQLAPDPGTALQWGLWPFLPGDVLKVALAAGLLPGAWRLLGRR